MIRQGRLCRECSNTKCKDLGTKIEPIEVECPTCDGHGCEQCNNGKFRVDGCPQSFCRDMVNVASVIDLFHKGMPPVSGGSLDQSASFIDAARQLQRDENILKAERQ